MIMRSNRTVIITIICCAWIGVQGAVDSTATRTEVYANRGGRDLEIHLHFPADWSAGDNRSSIIFFFGGGWANGTPEQFKQQAAYFASRGMVAARADYRVKSRDGVTPDECVRDARSAVRWMKKNAGKLGIDPDQMVTSGGSAGGHLAACMMIEDSVDAPDDDLSVSTMPAAMVLFNPVMTFEYPDLVKRLGDHAEVAPKISPNAHLNRNTPPSLILFGSEDRLIGLAEFYWREAEELGVRAEKYIAEGKGHGFFNKPPWRERTLIAADTFLSSLGILEGPPTLQDPAAGRVVVEKPTGGEPDYNSYLEEKQRYMTRFDVDADGRLALDEFTEMTRWEFTNTGKEGADAAAKKRFALKDTNQDGYVTPEELVLSLVELGYLPPEAAVGIDPGRTKED